MTSDSATTAPPVPSVACAVAVGTANHKIASPSSGRLGEAEGSYSEADAARHRHIASAFNVGGTRRISLGVATLILMTYLVMRKPAVRTRDSVVENLVDSPTRPVPAATNVETDPPRVAPAMALTTSPPQITAIRRREVTAATAFPPLQLPTRDAPPRLAWVARDVACDPYSTSFPVGHLRLDVCQRSSCSAQGCHLFASGAWKRPIDLERFRADVAREVARQRGQQETLCTLAQLGRATGHVSWAPLPARTALYGQPRPAVSSMNVSWPAMNITLKHDACQLPRVDDAYEHLVQLHAIAEVRGAPPGQHPVIMLRGDSIQRGTSSAWVNIFRQQPSALDRYVHEDIGYVVTAAGDFWCRGRYCWVHMNTSLPIPNSDSGGDDDGKEMMDSASARATKLFELRHINSAGQSWDSSADFYRHLLHSPQYGSRGAMLFLGGSVSHSCGSSPTPTQTNVWAVDRELIEMESPTRRAKIDRDRIQQGDRDRRGYLTMVWRTFHMFPGLAASRLPTAHAWPCQLAMQDAMLREAAAAHANSTARSVVVNVTDFYDYHSSDYNMWGGPTDFHPACILRDEHSVAGMLMTRPHHRCWNVHDTALIQMSVAAAMAP